MFVGCGKCGKFHMFRNMAVGIRWIRRFHYRGEDDARVVVFENKIAVAGLSLD